MKTTMKVYYLSLILLLAGTAGMQAQMTIGSSASPHGGALLDLKQPNASTKMGLKLPVVSLADASQYGLTSGDQTTAVGMVVYNDNANIANGHGAGVYVWNGTKWSSLLGNGGSTGEEPTVATVQCAGLTFMDRNLGVDPTADPNPTTSYNAGTSTSPGLLNGDYYQWGRKADGHEKWNSPVVDGPISDLDNNNQVPSTNSTYYGKFIKSTTPLDWRLHRDELSWSGTLEGGYGNPCPTGFRVPTVSEWQLVMSEITPANCAGLTETRAGVNVGTSTLFLPAAGYRGGDVGALFLDGGCYYWSGNVDGDGAWCLLISTPGPTVFAPTRAHGMPVRCVKL